MSFVMVPVVTYILGPEDIGLFALVSVIPSMIAVVGTMGGGYLLAEHFPTLDHSARQRMISSMLISGTIILSVTTAMFAIIWHQWLHDVQVFRAIPNWALVISFATMFFGFPWVIANDIVTLEANAKVYAIVTILQSLGSAGTTAAGLFLFEWGVLSLFAAGAIGSVISCAGAFSVLWPYCRLQLRQEWVRKIVHIGMPVTLANFIENFQGFVERYTVSSYAGLGQLGLFSHSQQYRALVAMILKAVARSIWPLTLKEARAEPCDFRKTKTAWTLAYVGVIAVGIIFATVGRELIATLTHGKFGDAFWMVGIWMVFILIQNSGKPETGILFAKGESVAYSRVTILSNLAAIILILLFVPRIGVLGVLIALIIQQAAVRMGVQLRARRHYYGGFDDGWVWAGSVIVGVVLACVHWFSLGLAERAGACVLLCFVLVLASRRYLVEALSHARILLKEISGLAARGVSSRSR
jgi:O-antigen/teichoic acid export membrane protein